MRANIRKPSTMMKIDSRARIDPSGTPSGRSISRPVRRGRSASATLPALACISRARRRSITQDPARNSTSTSTTPAAATGDGAIMGLLATAWAVLAAARADAVPGAESRASATGTRRGPGDFAGSD